MGYKFWKWVYDFAKKKMEPYRSRKCEHCLRWDTEAHIQIVADSADRIWQTTHCSGCGKNTEWGMMFMTPVWKSNIKQNAPAQKGEE